MQKFTCYFFISINMIQNLYFFLFLISNIAYSQITNQNKSEFVKLNFEDVVYKITENDSLKLDIFLPEIENPENVFPVVLYFHGGSWIRGNKTMVEPYFRNTLKTKLLEEGFAVVSVAYRFLEENGPYFPAPITDAKDAIRWIYASAEVYHFDSNNIGLIGESSGSHLALMAAYSPDDMWQDDENLKEYSSKVNYVIDNCGPTDINKLFHTNIGWFQLLLAKLFVPKKVMNLRNDLIYKMTSKTLDDTKKEVRENLKAHSVLPYVDDFAVPTLIFQAKKDRVVPNNQARKLYRKLKKNNINTDLIKIKGSEHVYFNLENDEIDKVITETIYFIKNHQK